MYVKNGFMSYVVGKFSHFPIIVQLNGIVRNQISSTQSHYSRRDHVDKNQINQESIDISSVFTLHVT